MLSLRSRTPAAPRFAGPAAPARPALLVALLMALPVAVLAGCAEPGQNSPGAQATGSSSAGLSTEASTEQSTGPSTAPTGVPTALPTALPTVPPAVTSPPGPGQPGDMTVRGMVQEGVEGGCLLLAARDGKQYLLLGGDRQVLRSGAAVVVQGHPEPGVATTCQQGTPFTVVSARPDVATTS